MTRGAAKASGARLAPSHRSRKSPSRRPPNASRHGAERTVQPIASGLTKPCSLQPTPFVVPFRFRVPLAWQLFWHKCQELSPSTMPTPLADPPANC